mgnify:CR=1 FL=1
MESIWFDSEGEAKFWKNIPLRTVKKAFFRKGSAIRALAKMVLNNVTYDFRETAQGGAVIVPPDFSAIEFIAPDGRINYTSLIGGNLGNAITETIAVLENAPIEAWDKFASWFGSNSTVSNIAGHITGCELRTIDRSMSTAIDIPDLANITDMASLLEAVKSATAQAHGQAMSAYRLDDSAFGWALKLIADGSSELTIGFIFRE